MLVPQLLGVSAVTFVLIRSLPGDPAIIMLGGMATPETIAAFHKRMGLDRPLWEQYFLWLRNLLQGDLGISLYTSHPVMTDLANKAPATLELIFLALFVAALIAIPLAVLASMKPNSVFDWIARFFGLTAGALPDFWVGLIFILVFFHYLGIAPPPIGRMDILLNTPPRVTGFYTIDTLVAGDIKGFGSAVSHLLLPVLTLALVNSGQLLKMTRTIFDDVLGSEFVRHARACGLPSLTVAKYALRNALPPVITLAGVLFTYLLGGAVLVESVYSWGGVGQYAVFSVTQSDFPAMQGFVLLAAGFTLLVYLVVDLLYFALDPRITY